MKREEITHHTRMQRLFKWQYLKAIARQSLPLNPYLLAHDF